MIKISFDGTNQCLRQENCSGVLLYTTVFLYTGRCATTPIIEKFAPRYNYTPYISTQLHIWSVQ
jgi:hypothetical protein